MRVGIAAWLLMAGHLACGASAVGPPSPAKVQAPGAAEESGESAERAGARAPTLADHVGHIAMAPAFRTCLPTGHDEREHVFRLRVERSGLDGSQHGALRVDAINLGDDEQNCINRFTATHPAPPATREELYFITVGHAMSPYYRYRFARQSPDQRLSTGRLTLVAGALGGRGRNDGAARDARLNLPMGLASDRLGRIVIADAENHAIRVFDPASGRVETLAEIPQVRNATADDLSLEVPEQNLQHPTALAVSPRGELFALDSLKGEIWRIESGSVERVWSPPEGSFDTPDSLSGPRAMTFETDDTLLIADSLNHRIVRLSLKSGSLSVVAGQFGRDGHRDGMQARFSYPEGLALGADDTLYVSDWGTNVIRQIDLDSGRVRTLAGQPGKGGHADGVGRRARFDAPSGLTRAGDRLFVAESQGLVVRQVDLKSARVQTIAGGYRQHGNADGLGSTARFSHHVSSALGEIPFGLVWQQGFLYLADSGNHTLRQIDPDTKLVATVVGREEPERPDLRSFAQVGEALYATAGQGLYRLEGAAPPVLVAGDPTEMGHRDGVGSGARFRGPVALAAVDDRTVAVGEVNGQVRHVDLISREVTTLVDLQQILYDVAVDDDGALYVSVDAAIGTISREGRFEAVAAADSEKHPRAIHIPSLAVAIDMAFVGARLYILDRRRHYSDCQCTTTTLREIDRASGTVRSIASWVQPVDGLEAPGPSGTAAAEDGSLVVTHSTGAVSRIDPANGSETVLLSSRRDQRGVRLGWRPRSNRPSAPAGGPDGSVLYLDEGALLRLEDLE